MIMEEEGGFQTGPTSKQAMSVAAISQRLGMEK